ncbi:MAG: VWA domain-containing protein [Gemmatimonadaceae bacterium]
MSEPEDVILDGARHATLFARRLWRRRAHGLEPAMLRLADVRGRLELFIGAAFGTSLTVAVAQPPALPNWFGRIGRGVPRHLVERRTLALTDGERVYLPRTLPDGDASNHATGDTASEGLVAYRLLACEAAARAVRGTPEHLPRNELVRDLYLLAEAAAVDHQLGTELPGLLDALCAARTAARQDRPRANLLTPQEAAVEQEIRAVLAAHPLAELQFKSPAISLAWAERTAQRIRELGGSYRGVQAVWLWGRVVERSVSRTNATRSADGAGTPIAQPRTTRLDRRPEVRQAPDDEDDEGVGMWMIQLDDPQEHVEDPMGLQRPTDRDDQVDPEDLADSFSELPEARLVSSPGQSREVLTSDDPPPRGNAEVSRGAPGRGYVYPEWDYQLGRYHERGAVIQEQTPPLGDAAWAQGVLVRRAALLTEVRRRFERLRPRRQRLGRQLDGPEVDLTAFVDAYADRQAGVPADDRLYEAVRPTRRDVAIALLVDVSGSTDSWVVEDLRIVDVEKEALLVVCDALDALGDPYTIMAFSGEGPECVTVLPLKGFDESAGETVRRRIAALEPDRYTRMGTAIRHATASLMRKPARHRLLLVLSDGKPNDVDRYEGAYGVEDSRQAVVEARLQGVHPFCVTVDRHAPKYMSRIFGAGGYAALHHPEHLPAVLVDVLRRLVKA